MKKLFYIFSLLLVSNFFPAQANLDSLNKIWNDSLVVDTVRANALNEIVNIIIRINPDSGFKLANIQLNFSKENNLEKHMFYSYQNLGNSARSIENSKISFESFFNALKIANRLNDTAKILVAETSIATSYGYFDKHDKAILYFDKAIDLCLKTNNENILAKVYHNKGKTLMWLQNYDSALVSLNKGLEIFIKQDFKLGIAMSQINVAIIKLRLGENKLALNNFFNSLEFFKKNNFNPQVSSCYSYIVSTYMEMGQHHKALKYAHLQYEIAKEIGVVHEVANSSDYLYSLYSRFENFEKALEFHEISIAAYDSVNKSINSKALIEEELKYEYEKKTLADSLFELEEQKIHQAKVDLHNAEIHASQTISNLVIVVLFIFVLFSVVIWYRFYKSQEKKELIKNQKQKVSEALTELEIKKKEIERKTLEILDSIHYAKYIQNSLLPENEELDKFFNKHVVFNLPKEIVGGDFYWFKSFGDHAIIIAADCTGHGVPGGFITMLGNLFIENSVSSGNKQPDKILKDLNRDIVTFLKQGEEDAIQDGMDISICLIDKKKRKILFSGARNGIYIVDEDSVKSINGSIIPVGGFYSKKEKFKEREYELQEVSIGSKEWVFMYTDGFYDQFGGEKGRSMGSKKFKEILNIAVKEEKIKASNFKNHFFNWMGDYPQIDDVLLVGFKV